MFRGYSYQYNSAFALPTVLISSVVMIAVLIIAIQASVSINTSIKGQYYDKLAQEATESGLAQAKACLANNNDVVTWSNSNPLRPGSNCNGQYNAGGCSPTTCYVLNSSTVKTTFSVGEPVTASDGSRKFILDGSVIVTGLISGAVRTNLSQQRIVLDQYIAHPNFGGGAGFEDQGHIGFLVTTEGQIYGFGDNSNQQVSDDTTKLIVPRPQIIKLPAGVTSFKKLVTSGQGASIYCGIASDDQVYCRGKSGDELDGLMYNLSGWQKLAIPGNLAVANINISGQGGDNLCALTVSGYVYCAGDNGKYGGYNALLGLSTNTAGVVRMYAPVKFTVSGDPKYSKVYNQDRFVCAITVAQDLYCQGNNSAGTLGNNSVADSSVPIKYNLGTKKAVDVLSSYHSWGSLVLHVLASTGTGNGTIWGSGQNSKGQLGNGTVTQQRVPVQFGTRTDYVSILSGPDHMCGITTVGDVFCAGNDTNGQLGNGGVCNTTVNGAVVQFILPTGEKAKTVLTTQSRNMINATIILTQSGNIYSAGDNTYGRFGNGTNNACVSTPVKMTMPAGVTATSLSSLDAYTTYFMGSDGRPYAVGRNNNGQLGDGTTIDKKLPVASILPRAQRSY